MSTPCNESVLITPRRNFLIRALGITAAGATMAVPVMTLDDPRKRIEHHWTKLREGWQDLFPATEFRFSHRIPDGLEADPRVMTDRFYGTIVAIGPKGLPR